MQLQQSIAKAGLLVPQTSFLPCQVSFSCFPPFVPSYSHYLSSLLADSYFLLLAFMSHSFSPTPLYVLLISLFPFYFLAVFFLFCTRRIYTLTCFLNPCSPSLLLISVLVSRTCFFDTYDLALLGLSDWYAVLSHTWQGTEV